MKKLIVTIVVLAWMAATAFGAENLDRAVNDSVISVLKELKLSNKLRGKKIAIYDFRNVETGKVCNALTSLLDDKVTVQVQQIKNLLDLNFTIVSRRDLPAVEAEYMLSRGGEIMNYAGAVSLLEKADILITGTWQKGEGDFEFVVKALEILNKGARELTSVSKTVDKYGLSPRVLDCLSYRKIKAAKASNAEIRVRQERIEKLDRQIEEIRVRKQSEQRLREMEEIIWKRKMIINNLLEGSGNKGVAYTTRRYDKNIAFLNIDTVPEKLDIYIDQKWVGRAPMAMYEIEAGVTHVITAKGDPRYYQPAVLKRKYEKFERIEEKLELKTGAGKVLLLGREPVEEVFIDGEQYKHFNPKKPIIKLAAGKRHIKIWKGSKRKEFSIDVWINDFLRKDYGQLEKPGTFANLITNSLGMEFAPIKPGVFMMGSEKGASDEEPIHKVTITKSFYMQTTEVTQGQWRAVMGSNPSYFPKCGDDCPVESVSWNDVQKFVKKLNQQQKNKQYRLPTEAEWEYACRAGSTAKYCFGDKTVDLDNYAWYEDNSESKTHSVARKKPNAWNLYDMHGNVRELCSDLYGDNFTYLSETDPEGATSGSNRVNRGGNWISIAQDCRSAERDYSEPNVRYSGVGFRLVAVPGK